MSDTATPPVDPAAAPAADPVAPVVTDDKPAPFTPAQQKIVDAIAAKARDAGRRSAEPAAAAPKPAAKPVDPAAPMSAADVQQMLQQTAQVDRAFFRATAGATITDEQMELMEAARPAGLDAAGTAAWANRYISVMGFPRATANAGASATTTTQPTTPAAATSPTTQPAAPPIAAPAAPSAHTLPTVGGAIDLFNLSVPQLNALGPAGVRGELEKMWAHAAQMSGAPTRQKPPSRR